MTTFRYTAIKNGEKIYERTVEARDRFEVYALVRREGGSIQNIEENTRGLSLSRAWESVSVFFTGVKDAEKIMLARNLATMIKAGLPLSRALDVMERQSKNKRMKHVLRLIKRDVTSGKPFHETLKTFPKVFSPLFTAMVRAGEESGKLVEALLVVAEQMERSYELKRKIRGALIYPSIIIAAMIGIGILMMIYVVPTLSETFSELGAELPRSTRAIIAVSDFLSSNLALAFLGGLAAVGGFVAAMRTRRGKRMRDFTLLHLPIISELVKEINSARTARTLASLLTAGVEVIGALAITRDVVQNSYYKEVLESAEVHIRKGRPIAKAFIDRADVYPVMVGDMMAVGEETGQLSDMLLEISHFYEEDVSQKTKNLSTVIEPFLMIIIGSAVGFFAVSMIAPIYSISNSI